MPVPEATLAGEDVTVIMSAAVAVVEVAGAVAVEVAVVEAVEVLDELVVVELAV